MLDPKNLPKIDSQRVEGSTRAILSQMIYIAGWKILVFNRKYIFNPGPLDPYVSLPEVYLYGCFQKLWYPKMDGENNGKPYENG